MRLLEEVDEDSRSLISKRVYRVRTVELGVLIPRGGGQTPPTRLCGGGKKEGKGVLS